MKKNKLTFVCADEGIFLNKELLPQPANKYIPKWYKNIKVPHEINKDRPLLSKITKPKTVRQCPSFIDVFEEGYVLPAPTDYYISLENGVWEWKTPISYNTFFDSELIEFHGDIQFVNHLPSNSNIKGVFKIILPYGVFGPKGYNIKLLPIPYAFNDNYHCNYGIQNLDNIFELNIQINFTSNKKEILIRKGEPLGIIVPYKREEFEIEYEHIHNSKWKNKIKSFHFKLLNTFNNRYYKSL